MKTKKPNKVAKQKTGHSKRECLICLSDTVEMELCGECSEGLNLFNRDKKLLGRAASYLDQRLPQQRCCKRPNEKKRDDTKELAKLIKAQGNDQRDRRLRFQHR